ncbi:hypothetical protein QYF36_014830 [Acer negundo]|nr:hypothetical protein QYF36_014830 [Acer negundo]
MGRLKSGKEAGSSREFDEIKLKANPTDRLGSDNSALAKEDDTSLPISNQILAVVKQSREDNTDLYVALSKDMRVVDHKQAKDVSDIWKELKLTPYTRRNRKAYDPAYSVAIHPIYGPPINEENDQLRLAME